MWLLLIAFLILFVLVRTSNFVYSGRSPINNIISNLRQIDGAKQQWALENNRASKDALTAPSLRPSRPATRAPQEPRSRLQQPLAGSARPPQPQPRRHCTVSTGDIAFCSDSGAVIGAAPAETASDPVPAAKSATAKSLAGIFIANSPLL